MDSKTKIDLLKTELLLMQQQVDKYDKLSSTIQSWAVTLWATSVGWFFQVERVEVIIVGILIILLFWFFNSINKNFRENYADRRDKVAESFNLYSKSNEEAINLPVFYLPKHKWKTVLKRGLYTHIFLPYVVLIFVSLVILLQL